MTDKANAQPLPFATVGVFSQKDSLIGGGITDEEGKFQVDLPFGQFYALVEFMGFEAVKSPVFSQCISQHDESSY